MSLVSGIVFFRTESHDEIIDWYTGTVGAGIWLEQPDCTILDYEGFRFGFCDRGTTDDCGIITFVYPGREEVDAMYTRIGDAARETPHVNDTYQIYQFFADDPDGRTAEFQTFLHDTP